MAQVNKMRADDRAKKLREAARLKEEERKAKTREQRDPRTKNKNGGKPAMGRSASEVTPRKGKDSEEEEVEKDAKKSAYFFKYT